MSARPAIAAVPRLSRACLSALPAAVEMPRYDIERARIGMVHFGPGAFHRAHQAWYADDLLRGDPRWAICAVSLRSSGLRDALGPQDGLYGVAVLDREPRYRIIGALRECLVAGEEPQRVLARLASPDTRLVTLTITEKGYCLGPDGSLDFGHVDIVRDLRRPRAPVSAIGYLAEGLRLRRAAGLRPFTVLSCDNLADNGTLLRRAVVDHAARSDPDLARWIEAETAFPRTMVDCIVPASDDALRTRMREATGVADTWPVQREAWSQWVIADETRGALPDLAAVGATLTDDVGGYENAKLRLLNGAHSALAYLGLLRGHRNVADAMADADLAGRVQRLMVEDIRPAVRAPRGLDVDAYIGAILARFRNPAIDHQLAQIAWDGSQKLPFRLFGTIADALAAGRPLLRLCLPVAAWLHFLRRAARGHRPVVDPLADVLLARALDCDGDPNRDVGRFLAVRAVFPGTLAADERFRVSLIEAYAELS